MRYTHVSLEYKRAAVAQLEKSGNGVPSNFRTAGSEQEGEVAQVVEIKAR